MESRARKLNALFDVLGHFHTAELFDRVSVILADWPNGFHLLFDEVRQFAEQDVGKHVGLEAEFRSFYTNLFRKQREVEHVHLILAEFA